MGDTMYIRTIAIVAALIATPFITACAPSMPTTPLPAPHSSATTPVVHTATTAPGYITVTNPNDPATMTFTIHGDIPATCRAAIAEWRMHPVPAAIDPDASMERTTDYMDALGKSTGAMVAVSTECANVPTR